MSSIRRCHYIAIASAFIVSVQILPLSANEDNPIIFDQPANTSTFQLFAESSSPQAVTAKVASSRQRAPHEAAPAGIRAKAAHHAAHNNVPAKLADAVIKIESRYNPRAYNAGNYGLMQIRLQTARSIGYGGGANGLFDAETNLRYGMRYLAQAYRAAGGDICGTVMRYQSGHRATRMNAANRVYCAKVRQYMAQG
jgi:soluble lytic murein transglycosylase-like protein